MSVVVGESDDAAASDGIRRVELESASNALLLGSPMDGQTLETGLALAAGDDPAHTRVVWVTMLNSSNEVVDLWDSHVQTRPAHLHILLLGDGLADTDPVASPAVTTESLADPTDLTTLGVRLIEATSATEREAVRLRFDSLTPLLQYVSRRSLAQFMHVLSNKLAFAGVTAHFHLDPMAHDDQTVRALTSICDARIRVDTDGVSVTQR